MQQFRRAARWTLELIYPQGNRCAACRAGMPHGSEQALCPDCQAALETSRLDSFILPGEEAMSEFAWADAAYRYEGAARQLVHRLKYGDTRLAAAPLGRAMAARLEPGRWDVVVPVPLHAKRLGLRGYNQAALLCAQVSRLCGLPMQEAALTRVHGGRSQVGMSRAKRLRNLDGAFTADPALVADKRVLLIDDVCTTGATGAACAVALWQAGAREVGLLTACRVGHAGEGNGETNAQSPEQSSAQPSKQSNGQ